MAHEIVRSEKEVEDLVQRCMDAEDEGKNEFWGMTYQQGIVAAIDWMTEEGQGHPIDGE